MITDECREKSRFVSKGEVTLHGVKIPYNTVCEDNFFLSEDGKPVASIFSYAYFRSDVADPSTGPFFSHTTVVRAAAVSGSIWGSSGPSG